VRDMYTRVLISP